MLAILSQIGRHRPKSKADDAMGSSSTLLHRLGCLSIAKEEGICRDRGGGVQRRTAPFRVEGESGRPGSDPGSLGGARAAHGHGNARAPRRGQWRGVLLLALLCRRGLPGGQGFGLNVVEARVAGV